MAKQTLPTNFKDDILSSSMGGKRRFNLIQNDDGTYSLEDATDYTQTGSDFGAGQINATNQAVNESCDKSDVINDPDDIVANQVDGKIAGAKGVSELISRISDINRYVFITMQARSVLGNNENYLNVDSAPSGEGDPSLITVTTGSAAIRVSRPGRYLMIVRLSVSSNDPNIEVNVHRWDGSEYQQYRGIASIQSRGMLPIMTVVSITEHDGRIAVMIKNNNNIAVSIGAGTAIILVPLF